MASYCPRIPVNFLKLLIALVLQREGVFIHTSLYHMSWKRVIVAKQDLGGYMDLTVCLHVICVTHTLNK